MYIKFTIRKNEWYEKTRNQNHSVNRMDSISLNTRVNVTVNVTYNTKSPADPTVQRLYKNILSPCIDGHFDKPVKDSNTDTQLIIPHTG